MDSGIIQIESMRWKAIVLMRYHKPIFPYIIAVKKRGSFYGHAMFFVFNISLNHILLKRDLCQFDFVKVCSYTRLFKICSYEGRFDDTYCCMWSGLWCWSLPMWWEDWININLFSVCLYLLITNFIFILDRGLT